MVLNEIVWYNQTKSINIISYIFIAKRRVKLGYTIMNNIDYKVGIYIRLSREDEEKEKYQESESIGNQRTLLMQYIRQNKLNFISEYVDDGVSGTSFDRPGFNKMIADIEARKNKYGCNKRFIKAWKKLCAIRIIY